MRKINAQARLSWLNVPPILQPLKFQTGPSGEGARCLRFIDAADEFL
jgi:hypothetical protein